MVTMRATGSWVPLHQETPSIINAQKSSTVP